MAKKKSLKISNKSSAKTSPVKVVASKAARVNKTAPAKKAREYKNPLTPEIVDTDPVSSEETFVPEIIDAETIENELEILDNDPLDAVELKPATRVSVSKSGKQTIRAAQNMRSTTAALTTADPVARYMAEIRRYPLLTREEEHALAVKYHETGDREAAQKLVTSNLRFVVKVAMEYSKFGAKLIDLIQEGNVGLMQAVKDFNPHKGVRLITYAVWWIRGHIQDFLMRHYSMVRIGTTHNQRKLFYELQRSRAQLERMGLESGLMQISGRLGIPEDEVKEMSERVLQRDVSLDKPLVSGETGNLLDVTSNANEVQVDDQLGRLEELELLKEAVEKLRPELNDREVYILDKRILADEPITLQDVGDKYGTTREAARQIEAKLITKIKNKMVSAE